MSTQTVCIQQHRTAKSRQVNERNVTQLTVNWVNMQF